MPNEVVSGRAFGETGVNLVLVEIAGRFLPGDSGISLSHGRLPFRGVEGPTDPAVQETLQFRQNRILAPWTNGSERGGATADNIGDSIIGGGEL
jgi:hypothetical protein